MTIAGSMAAEAGCFPFRTFTCLPFEDASFDLVICSEVLEHISDDKTAVSGDHTGS